MRFERVLSGVLLLLLSHLNLPRAAAQDGSLAGPVPAGVLTRWSTPENPDGSTGGGNRTNRGAKGHAWDAILPGATLVLLNTQSSGQINRIKMTLQDRSPAMLRSLRLEMRWDGEQKPAVSVPLGDFFGTAFGLMPKFENAYFADPEEHSLLVALPMPFRKGARVTITNDGTTAQTEIYWEVDWQQSHVEKEALYFHAHWHRAQPALGEDFDLLPAVHGKGRFLGVVMGLAANPAYTLPGRDHDVKTFWWGEGEVRLFVDDDGVRQQGREAAEAHPTLAGTGGEDYFGTAWGLGQFTTAQAGCTVADPATLRWSCYRFHGQDPVWFRKGIRAAIQQIGGSPIAEVRAMAAQGTAIEPVAVDGARYARLLEMTPSPALGDKDFPDGWVLYRRSDDWCATAYFYLETPTDDLPAIQPVAERVRGLTAPGK